LNMAPESVDDQYVGCTHKMEKLVRQEYLVKEFQKSNNFEKAWKAGENKFKEIRDNLARSHLIAMYVYTLNTVYGNFNNEVRTGKQKYKNKTFAWYSLHFLLTKALQILKKQQNKSYSTIYRGTKSKFKGGKGITFRFGSFTSFSLDKGVAQGFARIPGKSSGTGHCFEIKNYKGAEVSKYSEYPGEKEVLIPPYEMFKVTAVKTNDWCVTVFVLESAGDKSDLNCALFKYKKYIFKTF
ncbi:NAD(P)(+)--arginine ADP-ribosyltransferase 2, partial [Anabarilius grahami]